MAVTGKIFGINGPVVYIKGNEGFKIAEMVYVGPQRLVGEVISLEKEMTTIQVYEETTGLKPGDIVTGSGGALSVTLAPGIITNIFDGIERPLEKIAEHSGSYIDRGFNIDSLDTTKKWDVKITVKKDKYQEVLKCFPEAEIRDFVEGDEFNLFKLKFKNAMIIDSE